MERIQPPNYYSSPFTGNQIPLPRDETKDNNTQNEYSSDYLKINIGRKVSVFCSFTDSAQWHDEVFSGILEATGDDYIIVEDKVLNKSILIMSVYINYIEFPKDQTKAK